MVITATMLVVVVQAACDPTYAITFQNKTNENVSVLLEGGPPFELKDGQTKTYDIIKFDAATLEVRAPDGHVLLAETLTPSSLKQAHWRVVIEQ